MSKLTVEELKSYLGTNHTFYPDQLTEEDLWAAGFETRVALVPKDYKVRVRYFGNLFVQMCFAIETEDPKLKRELLTLAQSLSYLLNSTSYEKGQYCDFDKSEINKKLHREEK